MRKSTSIGTLKQGKSRPVIQKTKAMVNGIRMMAVALLFPRSSGDNSARARSGCGEETHNNVMLTSRIAGGLVTRIVAVACFLPLAST